MAGASWRILQVASAMKVHQRTSIMFTAGSVGPGRALPSMSDKQPVSAWAVERASDGFMFVAYIFATICCAHDDQCTGMTGFTGKTGTSTEGSF